MPPSDQRIDVQDYLETKPLALLSEGMAALGLELSRTAREQFRVYLEELKLWNAKINLTGLKTDQDIVIKHFLDSLAVFPYVGSASALADLGSGAGFPGLVFKLVRPQLALTLVEVRGKKAAFLEYLVARLGLKQVEVLQTHLAPTVARKIGPRFQVVISRAAFILPRFLELAAPMLPSGGAALALKGVHLAPGELEAANSAGNLLGFHPLELHKYHLPLNHAPRLLVTARKK